MCGYAGFFSPGGLSPEIDTESILRRMTDTIAHRGPDDQGYWVDRDKGIALGHRRLSILDLSSAGHQPMKSHSNRYVIVYNGEIYNHLHLRKELEKHQRIKWRGHSDTETILRGIEEWGIENTLKKMVGMFSLAIWDKKKLRITIARDRMGEKPLYYGWLGNVFLFGSELKSLQQHPNFRSTVNREALTLYLKHGYIPGPYSIFESISKLTPGTFLQLDLSSARVGVLPEPVSYWSVRDAAQSGIQQPYQGSYQESREKLETLLLEAVDLQMISDVPLGAFLSGGIDSSLIVAMMQNQVSEPVKTFTIGFHEQQYNEASDAAAVAQYLGTNHTEMYVSPSEAMEIIPKLPVLYDEPFGDTSAIPTYLVSRLAREEVTVSLSGDGGDELFGGYSRYRRGADIWSKISAMPGLGRAFLANSIDLIPSEIIDRYIPSLLKKKNVGSASERLKTVGKYLRSESIDEFYNIQISQWKDPDNLLANGNGRKKYFHKPNSLLDVGGSFEHMMFNNTTNYLPDDILVKVDRAAMAVSLESRVPMLDHRVVEFAWQLPLQMKIQDGKGKRILRDILYDYVPRKLLDRPKKGFGVPVDYWIRDELRDWAESLLSEKKLKEDGFFNAEII